MKRSALSTHSTSAHQIILGLLLAAGPGRGVPAAASPACTKKAVNILKKYSPSGYQSYQMSGDKSVFESFSSDCTDKADFMESGIATAVHETNHLITSERGAYHLVSNELVPVPPTPSYFAPDKMVPALRKELGLKDDIYFKTYLDTKENSAHEVFTQLLDELNAYTLDTQTQIDLVPVQPLNKRNGGLPALMTFVAAYVKYARDQSPAVFRHMTSANPEEPARTAIKKLWAQAERVLAKECRLAPKSESDNPSYVKSLCEPSRVSAISSVLGRQSQCPKDCLSGSGPPSESTGRSSLILTPVDTDRPSSNASSYR